MGGDSESAFKNTPILITSIPLGPFHKNFLKIWASDNTKRRIGREKLFHANTSFANGGGVDEKSSAAAFGGGGVQACHAEDRGSIPGPVCIGNRFGRLPPWCG